ncbi:tripartite motif-containing protein 16-like isoform 2-T2 [Spinachia spinachia]
MQDVSQEWGEETGGDGRTGRPEGTKKKDEESLMMELTRLVQEAVRGSSWWERRGIDCSILAAAFLCLPPAFLLLGSSQVVWFLAGVLLMAVAHAVITFKGTHLASHGALSESQAWGNFWAVFFIEICGSFSARAGVQGHIKMHHAHTNVVGLGDSSVWKVPCLPRCVYLFVAPLAVPVITPLVALAHLRGHPVALVLRTVLMVALGLYSQYWLLIHVSGFLSPLSALLCMLACRAMFSVPYIHVNIFQKELSEKQGDMVRMVTAGENAINKLQLNTVSIEHSVTEVRAVIESQFEELQAVVERAKREVTEILEGEEKQALKQAEGIRVHLEQRCSELKKTQGQMEKLSKHKNDVDFLQEYSQWKKESTDISLPSVYIGLTDRLNSLSGVIVESTRQLCAMLVSSYIEKVKETSKNDKMGIKTTVREIAAKRQHVSSPNPVTHADFLKYVAHVSFDADSAHKFLRLTEENRKVTNTTPWQHPYPDVPQRFENWRQVLATESFYLGRHYFEADISGEGTHVGVTYKSIERKGGESSGCITGNDFSWCVQWNGRAFSAWHSGVETPLAGEKFRRLGVYVDYGAGLLAFYGVDDALTLIHEYRAEFLEPLYPAFWLSKKENVVALVAPGEPLRLKSPSPPASPTCRAVASMTAAEQ